MRKPRYQYKGDNSLKDKINKSPAPENKYEASETWTERFDGLKDSVLIEVDANIEIPDVIAFPVVEIEPDEITQEKADSFIDGLIGDAPFMAPRTEKTKSEIEQEILITKKSINDPTSDFNTVLEKGTSEYEIYLEDKLSFIKFLEEALKIAPETIEKKEASKQFQRLAFKKDDDVIEGPLIIEGHAQFENNQSAYLQITKSDSPFYEQHVAFEKDFISTFRSNLVNLNDLSISIDEAENAAQEFLRKLGFQNMQVSLVCSAYKESTIKKIIWDAQQCYVFYFTRTVEGIPLTFQENRLDDEALAKQYAPLWGQEVVRVAVDDTGVIEFYYGASMKVTKVINPNVELLPFEDIQEIFRKYISMKSLDFIDMDPAIIQRRIHIDRIVLGLTMVMQKDSPGKFMLIPTWSFFGYEVNKFNEKQPGGYKLDENNEYREDAVGRSFLTINAMDGSVIDPAVGYSQDHL